MSNLTSHWKESRLYQLIVRYKLYHILFWAGLQLFWGGLFNREYLFTSGSLLLMMVVSLGQAIGAYSNVYYFIPKYLKRGDYFRYGLGLIGCILVAMVLTGLSYYIVLSVFNGSWQIEYWWPTGIEIFYGSMTSMGLTAVIAVMIVKLTKDRLKDQKRTQELEKEKLETELKFLRSQFNPHFLFNTINSIHFLIEKDPKMATDTLSKFSDLLRYQLYECNEPQIPLKKEVHYLANFVALEKLRVNENVPVALDVSENVNGAQIAPFILMPFVENAFKHVSKSKQQDNFIRISLAQQEEQIQFSVENSQDIVEPKSRDAVYYGGIGLANVKRRLDLLYPQQHTLKIDSQNNTYFVQLTIDLHEN